MAHLLRFIITATAVTVARFLHLFKFGLVVYGTSNVPRIGGSRETPAYFFFKVFHKLLSACGGIAELSADFMICHIATQ